MSVHITNNFGHRKNIQSWDKAYKKYYASEVHTYKISDEELNLIVSRIKPNVHPISSIGYTNRLKYKYKQDKRKLCS